MIGASGSRVYGWFPGLHGTVGALGHNASIHVPFSDVFQSLKGIIPIAVEADKGRFVMPVDFLWMKFGVDNGIPINDFGQTSINTRSDTVDLDTEGGISGSMTATLEDRRSRRNSLLVCEPEQHSGPLWPKHIHGRPIGSMAWAAPGS